MKAVLLLRHGGPEALQYIEDYPIPRCGPQQVLVKVKAAGVNNTDINTRLGWYSKSVTSSTADSAQLSTANNSSSSSPEDGAWSGSLHFPRIQGGDLCGEIVEMGSPTLCGAQGEPLSVGQRITTPLNQPRPTAHSSTSYTALGSESDGAFAQYCVLEAGDVYHVSSSPLSDIEVAAVPCSYGTALNLLRRGQLQRGEEVLITGASGGVGLAAVQLAHFHFGARVTALSGTTLLSETDVQTQKTKVVLEAGASRVLSRDSPLSSQSFDVVIDVVGGKSFGTLLDVLRPGGRLCVSGAIAGPMVELDLRTLYLKDLVLSGCTYQSPEIFRELVEIINKGKIRPVVSKSYPLREIARAQKEFQDKIYPGKLVLLPW